jgi:riboflavin kinase/FMN adenylyltransferase
MKVVDGATATPEPRALAIGNFDGVHRGHQELVRVARARGAAIGAEAGVATFTPHPAKIFAPALAPPLIVSLPRRLELLAAAGAQVAIVEAFTREFAAIEAESFVRDVLVGRWGAREVVVGYDFSFGRARRGDPAMLQALGRELGVGVTIVPPVTLDGLPCSSTKVREFVLEGRVEGAGLLLGRPVEITGTVVHGQGRGRALGVPTANLAPEAELLPRLGIYAAWAHLLGADGAVVASHRAALSVGTNPTFTPPGAPAGGDAPEGGAFTTVEPYLLDFEGDLYGRRLRLDVMHRLRDERRFESTAALVAQIEADVAEVRARLP